MKEIVRRGDPHLPQRWSYSASVRRMKATVWKWKRTTATMLHELYVAHEILSHRGARTDLDAKATKSWDDYCEAIGLNRVTAWRWLKQYDPVGRKLIEADPPAERPRPVLAPAPPAEIPSRPTDDDRLLAEIAPRISKMSLAHRLRIAARVVLGR